MKMLAQILAGLFALIAVACVCKLGLIYFNPSDGEFGEVWDITVATYAVVVLLVSSVLSVTIACLVRK